MVAHCSRNPCSGRTFFQAFGTIKPSVSPYGSRPWPLRKRPRNTPTRSLKFRGVVHQAGGDPATYRLALRQAEAAFRLVPSNADYLTALGVAHYRMGHYREAVEALYRVDRLTAADPDGPAPDLLAFLALGRHHAGETGQAKATLARLREALKKPRWAGMVVQPYVHEAELIQWDLDFPADPFTQ